MDDCTAPDVPRGHVRVARTGPASTSLPPYVVPRVVCTHHGRDVVVETCADSAHASVTLGVGTYGTVVRGTVAAGHDTHRGRRVSALPCAIKFMSMLTGAYVNPDAIREISALNRVDHRNVARLIRATTVRSLGCDDDGAAELAVIVMRYAPGETLWPPRVHADRDAVPIARDLAAALAHVHARGLVHCDVKPNNVIVDARTNRVTLVDFNMCMGEGPRCVHNIMAPAYRDVRLFGCAGADESDIARTHSVDWAVDMWAYACILVELVSGAQLFRVRRAPAARPPPPHGSPGRRAIGEAAAAARDMHTQMARIAERVGALMGGSLLKPVVLACLSADPRKRIPARLVRTLLETELFVPRSPPTKSIDVRSPVSVADPALVLRSRRAHVHRDESVRIAVDLTMNYAWTFGAAEYALVGAERERTMHDRALRRAHSLASRLSLRKWDMDVFPLAMTCVTVAMMTEWPFYVRDERGAWVHGAYNIRTPIGAAMLYMHKTYGGAGFRRRVRAVLDESMWDV